MMWRRLGLADAWACPVSFLLSAQRWRPPPLSRFLLVSPLLHIVAPFEVTRCLCYQGKRYALPNTRIMMHHPSGTARGQASDIQNEARELMRVRDYVSSILALATDKTNEKAWQHAFPCWRLGCRLRCIARQLLFASSSS